MVTLIYSLKVISKSELQGFEEYLIKEFPVSKVFENGVTTGSELLLNHVMKHK